MKRGARQSMLRRAVSADVISAPLPAAASDQDARLALVIEIINSSRTRSAWVNLKEIVGLAGVPASIAEIRKWLVLHDAVLKEFRLSCDGSICAETVLHCLPLETLVALKAKRDSARREREAQAEEARRRPAMCGWTDTAKLVGLPGMPATLAEIDELAWSKGFPLGRIDAEFLPIETRRALADRLEREQAELPPAPAIAANSPDHWELQRLLSNLALARHRDAGARLTATQVRVLLAHLGQRSAA